MLKLLPLILLFLTACTPLQAHNWAAEQGIDLNWNEAKELAEFVSEQDCLPSYVHNLNDPKDDQYFECAIRDSAARYGINLDDWARISWCETSQSYENNDPSQRRLIGIDTYNDSSGASGPFQQLPRFWAERQRGSGYYGDIMNPRVNAFVSAWLFAVAPGGGASHWRPSYHCHGVR